MWVAMFICGSCTDIAFRVSRDCKRSLPNMEYEIERKLADIGQLPPEYWYITQIDDITWELNSEIDGETQQFAEFRALGV